MNFDNEMAALEQYDRDAQEYIQEQLVAKNITPEQFEESLSAIHKLFKKGMHDIMDSTKEILNQKYNGA